MDALAHMRRRIGTNLHIALRFAGLLTLVSCAVGVYHFKRNEYLTVARHHLPDIIYQASSESVPALVAS